VGSATAVTDFHGGAAMKKLAAQEKDPKLKADFEKQAAAYRKLAEKRAKEYGLKMPSGKNT
jgi:ABC-type Zn uptake system ZnuABC Zn-binding protein ZnuA